MFRFACGNLLSRPVRSTLSILGLTVAIAGMVGLFSIAGGIDQLVVSTFKLIPGLLVQQRGAPVPLFSTLPSDWRSELEQVEGVAVVNPEIMARVNVIEGKTIVSPPRFFLGTDIHSRLRLQHGVYNEHLVAGRFLQPDDVGTRNCVVSREIADEFQKDVGDTLRVNGHDLTIVGLYHCGSMLIDVSILMDIDAVRSISRFDNGSVSVYYLETTGEEDDDVISGRIEAQFADRDIGAWQPFSAAAQLLGTSGAAENPLTELFRNLDRSVKGGSDDDSSDGSTPGADSGSGTTPAHQPAESGRRSPTGAGSTTDGAAVDKVRESPVEVRSADDWAEQFDEFTADLDLFLTLMTGIGVVIAVLSIVNTMLMSVTERRIEFGILRANGWSRGHVLRLVTFESALLGIVGGVLGAALGWCATHVVNWCFPDRVYLYAGFGLLASSLAFSTLLGMMGGVYPAWMAARLSPMEAIRRG
jgi:putative ABC transport system permease protein